MNTKLNTILVMTLVLALLGLTAAHAQKDATIRGSYVSDGPQLEIFTSSFGSDLPANATARAERLRVMTLGDAVRPRPTTATAVAR